MAKKAAKKKITKKRNATDATLRNVKASNKQNEELRAKLDTQALMLKGMFDDFENTKVISNKNFALMLDAVTELKNRLQAVYETLEMEWKD